MAELEVVQTKPVSRDTAEFWSQEIEAAEKMLRTFYRDGNKIVDRYKTEGSYSDTFRGDSGVRRTFRLNLFSSNINTLQALLYGQLPKVDVARRFQDPNDDTARVAGDILERLLNLDIQENGEEYDAVLKSTLQDRLLPGNGCARVRYELETEQVTVGEVLSDGGEVLVEGYQTERIVKENAPIDYFHWQDVLWGWCRQWADMPWLAYASYLTKKEATARFGKEQADLLTYKKQQPNAEEPQGPDEQKSNVQKAKIWEIWDKETRKIRFWSYGCTEILDKKDDFLGLKGFFPSPPFLMANPTTKLYVPVPDFKLAEDLYNEVDVLQTRIAIITEAVKVVGVYAADSDGVQRMLKEGHENELIPVDDWALWAEKGGLQGMINWNPVGEIAAVLDKLIQVRDQTIALLQEINGMSDVMRGTLNNQYEGVGQSQIKANFGSARVQNLQDQFARFASDLMQIKAEVICKHFSPETIAKQSNIMQSMNAPLAPQAIQLLKEPNMAYLRIEIRAETMALIDYAKLKQERSDWLNAFSTFLQSAAPLIAEQPESLPFLMQILKWTMSGLKGSNEIEGVMDSMIQAAVQQQQTAQEQPDPEAQKQQGEMAKIQAKTQGDMQVRAQDLQADIQTRQVDSQAKIKETLVAGEVERQNMLLKAQLDAALAHQETQGNIDQANATAQAETRKTAQEAVIELEKQEAETARELRQKAEEAIIDSENFAQQKLIEDDADALQQGRQQEEESE